MATLACSNTRPSTMRRSFNPLPRWQEALLAFCSLLLLSSGIAWLVLHYGLGGPMEGLPHPWEATMMRLHGLGIFIALFLLGALASAHIAKGWHIARAYRMDSQRTSGIVLCAQSAALTMTGYILYYWTPEPIRPGLGITHAIVGMSMVPIAFWHARNHCRTMPHRR